MKSKKVGRTDPELSRRMLEEFEKEFDFSKVEKRVVPINLDTDIVNYFKKISLKTGTGYQILIMEALRYFIDEKLGPRTVWKKK